MPCARRTLAWIILVASVTAASAQEPSGRTVAVVPDASASGSSGVRILGAQQAVFMGDRIRTGVSGEAQIVFSDDTRLVVGPNASLVVDEFIVSNRNKASRFALAALGGAFRFISGNSPKSAYAISTPTATLGIRGTQFDFYVKNDGGTDFVLFSGQARVCDRLGNCVVARRPCTMISIPANGPMRSIDAPERTQRLRENFPYVLSQQARLRTDFRANVASCGLVAHGTPAIQDIRTLGGEPPDRDPRPTSPDPPEPSRCGCSHGRQ
jgi:hypothetical protein